MQIFPRTHCAILEQEPIEEIYTLKDFPISMNCVETARSQDQFADMKWGASISGNVQLTELLDPSLIYTTYHNPGTVGKIWREHHASLSSFICEDHFYDVLEIGGASGLLAENFCQTDQNFTWTIVEPARQTHIQDNRVRFENAFFEQWKTDQQWDVIVHSHVLEHTYSPIDFLKKAHSLLKLGGYQYISIPNMHYWLTNGFTNTLSFEHTFYLDSTVLEYLLNKTGFKIVEQRVNSHSIVVKAQKVAEVTVNVPDFGYIKDLFLDYVRQQKDDVAKINRELAGRPFYLFGAHIFAQSLFNFGLDSSKVINLLDNDTKKQNKRLYGTDCWVKSPNCLKDVSAPVIVLRGGSYTEEIKESILAVNPTTIFI